MEEISEVVMAKCPICGKSELVRRKRHAEQYGFDLGVYMAEICPSCGEVFWDEKSVLNMEQKAKKLGIWVLSRERRLRPLATSWLSEFPNA